jgi:hypothetical protein
MKTVEGQALDAKFLTLLESGESAVFAARPSYATVRPGVHWDNAALLLTDRRFVISKDKLFGKPKPDFAAGWSDVERVEGSLWNGGGPQIQLLVFNSRTVDPIELIVSPEHAVEVESAIRSGYLSTGRYD